MYRTHFRREAKEAFMREILARLEKLQRHLVIVVEESQRLRKEVGRQIPIYDEMPRSSHHVMAYRRKA
jgi:hypothetical protein